MVRMCLEWEKRKRYRRAKRFYTFLNYICLSNIDLSKICLKYIDLSKTNFSVFSAVLPHVHAFFFGNEEGAFFGDVEGFVPCVNVGQGTVHAEFAG